MTDNLRSKFSVNASGTKFESRYAALSLSAGIFIGPPQELFHPPPLSFPLSAPAVRNRINYMGERKEL